MSPTTETHAANTWCPGCGNFGILTAVRSLIDALAADGVPREDIVLVSGIGCHAKIVDYLQVNSFYALHGRTVPVATGIKLANPKLTVIAHMGDGDGYGEGLEHLLFAAKRNVGITAVVHNNGNYALTTGQASPTSKTGFRGRSTPAGIVERPFEPLSLAIASGATFVARAYARGAARLTETLHRAVRHEGFALVDVLQVCATFNNLYDYYNERVFDLEGHDEEDREAAFARAREWTFGDDGPVALGVFYRELRPTFEQQVVPGVAAEGGEAGGGEAAAPPPAEAGGRDALIAKLFEQRV